MFLPDTIDIAHLRQLSTDDLAASVDMAAYPEALWDQKGRYWSRWETQIPGHYRVCKKCSKRIRQGYILHPHLETAICETHIKNRWI